MKPKIKGALFRCGRCGKSYSNPFGHTCVARIGSKPGKTKLSPTASLTCPKCHKPYGNPLTHTCTVRTDFKRRAAAAKKGARQARPEHPRASACRDADCKRAACAAYREGREDGYQDGHEAGYEKGHKEGYRVGYNRGFPDGMAACPREHK